MKAPIRLKGGFIFLRDDCMIFSQNTHLCIYMTGKLRTVLFVVTCVVTASKPACHNLHIALLNNKLTLKVNVFLAVGLLVVIIEAECVPLSHVIMSTRLPYTCRVETCRRRPSPGSTDRSEIEIRAINLNHLLFWTGPRTKRTRAAQKAVYWRSEL